LNHYTASVVLAESIHNNFKSMDKKTRSTILKVTQDEQFRMKRSGQDRPVWDCSVNEAELINKEVVAKTGVGEVIGRAVYFGIKQDSDGVFKRTVLVHVPSSGAIYESIGHDVRLATDVDVERMRDEIAMSRRVGVADDQAKQMMVEIREQKVTGSKLVDRLLDVASTKRLIVEDKAGFHKIRGNKKGVCVYLLKKGGRADLSGFCVEHPAVVPMSAEEARERHLGRVRGQVNFSCNDERVVDAWEAVLKELS
jgi:hypothetical protein